MSDVSQWLDLMQWPALTGQPGGGHQQVAARSTIRAALAPHAVVVPDLEAAPAARGADLSRGAGADRRLEPETPRDASELASEPARLEHRLDDHRHEAEGEEANANLRPPRHHPDAFDQLVHGGH